MRQKLLFLSILLTFIFYGFLYRDRVLPNVYLGNLDVSGMGGQELRQFLEQELGQAEERQIPLFVEDGDLRQELDLNLRDLGVRYDRETTLQSIYAVGRDRAIAGSLLHRAQAPFVKTVVSPHYLIDSSKFSSKLDSELAKYLSKAKDATIVYESGEFVISGEKPGRNYDRELLAVRIRERIENFSQDPILVSFVAVEPDVLLTNAGGALEKVQTLKNQRIVLLFGRDRWSLSGNKLLSVLDFKPKGHDAQDFSLNFGSGDISVVLSESGAGSQKELEVSLDEAAISQFIDGIGNAIDVETVDATLVFEGERVLEFTPARDGQKLDRSLTLELLLSKVSVDTVSGEQEIVINLPVAVTRAKIASEEVNSLGIKELIGRGVSYFAGSIANRVHNLSLGAQRINGTIVAPGEVFSFNRQVGEVSGATGYRPAYVISSGRTVLDDGGGICQVSTTVFRAALASGLPILARTAHAYRVGYYEQRGFKAGLDATVWAPAVDLVFENDTQNHILVQAVVDPANAKLQVDIYGTNDGRKVELSQPVVSNIRPAPDPRYQDDPSLPRGTTKQVDFAADGATSVFTRKVYKGDQLIIDDVFKSNFRPWQAVYLVGTGG